MQDNLIIMGINAPKEHQAVITRLIHGLADLYLKNVTSLFPYPETMIDEGQTSPAPDILLYDHWFLHPCRWLGRLGSEGVWHKVYPPILCELNISKDLHVVDEDNVL